MPKKCFTDVALGLLALSLIASISLNAFLFRQGRGYYLELNNTRLDPLGLSSFSIATTQSIDSGDKPLVVFFGDSRAAEWIAPTDIADMVFINRGIGAQTTAQALGRFPYHITPLKANVILIQVGINDLKTIPLFPEQKATIVANCKANIQQIVELSVQNELEVVLTTIFPLGQIPLERRPFWSDDVSLAIEDLNQFIRSLKSEKVVVFDATKVLANGHGIVDPLYSRDFLHLNMKGYEALNRELIRVLRP